MLRTVGGRFGRRARRIPHSRLHPWLLERVRSPHGTDASHVASVAQAVAFAHTAAARAALKAINRFPVCEIDDLFAGVHGQLVPATERPSPNGA